MLILALLAAAASPADGKIMATDDWGKLQIYGIGGEPTGALFVQVHAGDLDGDGTPDDAVLKLDCDGNQLRGAQYTVVARESGSGMPTGKRQHAPITIVKEWGAATPELMKLKPSYDVKQLKGNERVAMAGGWRALTLAQAEGLCPAAAAAATTVVKSKSNITNN